MTTDAECTFNVTAWDEKPYQEFENGAPFKLSLIANTGSYLILVLLVSFGKFYPIVRRPRLEAADGLASANRRIRVVAPGGERVTCGRMGGDSGQRCAKGDESLNDLAPGIRTP